jgi:hypothetical protein
MIPFHSLFPDLAQRKVRCVHIGPAPGAAPDSGPPADEYAYPVAFQRVVLDEPYRLRLRRHYQLFRDELARRAAADKSPKKPIP